MRNAIEVILIVVAFGITALYGGIFIGMFFNTLFGSMLAGFGGLMIWMGMMVHAFHTVMEGMLYYGSYQTED